MVSMLRAPQKRGLKYNNLEKEVGKDCYYCLLLRNKATLTQSKNESEGETEAQIHCMCVYLQWTQTQVSTQNTSAVTQGKDHSKSPFLSEPIASLTKTSYTVTTVVALLQC